MTPAAWLLTIAGVLLGYVVFVLLVAGCIDTRTNEEAEADRARSTR